ncbi:mechanosensitive ion channel family protein [Nocardioides sp. Kera G14]|uniref:mechanosensitive ion channel family protein n=1 Tax=Nocardioides sp. Kera G14 TaxID=2884264 RepID=UPI001D12E6A6|nr:mechanosensitive ion channel family protein [Nocardioides sp. Kera G14]UDY23288.1 mechanosensitive ion channel family protein [Nocardioides sp. Kera G14]
MIVLASDAATDLSTWARGSGLEIVLWITGAVLFARFVTWVGERLEARLEVDAKGPDNLVRSEEAKRQHALAQVITWVLVVLFDILAAVKVLEALGVELSAVVPAATVAGVALGFGAQKIVGDLLSGFFLLAERQYGYGDLIRVSVVGLGTPMIGTVEDVSLRITTIRTPAGEVVMTPNGQIAQVTNLSRGWARAVIDVPIPVTVDVNRVTDILREVGANAFRDADLRPLLLDKPAVMGVESIEVDQFQVRVVARTLPGRQFDVGRMLRQMITRALLAEGIRLPTQLATGEPTSS